MESGNIEIFSLSEKSWRIEQGGVRFFLFEGEEKALLVDSGFGGSIRGYVEKLTKKPVILVNTHADPDHFGGNSEFEKAYMSPHEFSLYHISVPNGKVEPLWEGDIIDIGGRRFEVIDIPGHTPGSIALLDREARIVITGDSVAEFPIFMFGRARNMRAMQVSLTRLRGMSDAFDTIYPSHGPFPLTVESIDHVLDGIQHVFDGDYTETDSPMEVQAKLIIAGQGKFFMNL